MGHRKLYRQRKKIESVFADTKEKHEMRYTQYQGLAQVTNWVRPKFVDMNLKSWQSESGIKHISLQDNLFLLFKMLVVTRIDT